MNSFISGNCHPAMKPKPDYQMEPSQYLSPGQLLEKDVHRWSVLLYSISGMPFTETQRDDESYIRPGTRSWKWTCLRELRYSTSSALDCAHHICQRKMLVNAVHY